MRSSITLKFKGFCSQRPAGSSPSPKRISSRTLQVIVQHLWIRISLSLWPGLRIRDQLQCTVPGIQGQRLALELLEPSAGGHKKHKPATDKGVPCFFQSEPLWRSQHWMEGIADRSSPSLHDGRNVILRVVRVLHVPLLCILRSTRGLRA